MMEKKEENRENEMQVERKNKKGEIYFVKKWGRREREIKGKYRKKRQERERGRLYTEDCLM